MRICCLCNKKINSRKLFPIPKNERRRRKWTDNCGIQFAANNFICDEHFLSTDIIRGPHKISLTRNAVPLPKQFKNEQIVSTTKLQSNSSHSPLEYVHINTIYGQVDQKCRCCTNPSSLNFIQLDSCLKTNEEEEKTYKDLLYEITNIAVSIHQESILPQQICQKCEDLLKSTYKFIQQACKVTQQYISLINQENTEEDIKNIEHLQESLIEISEEDHAESSNIECNMEIKQEEKSESDIFMTANLKNDANEVEKELRNSITDRSSEDEEDSGETDSEKSIDTDVNNDTVARSCNICHKVYRNEKFLNVHKRYTHMPDDMKLPCPLCSYKASRTSALKVHMGLVHGQDKVNEYFKPKLDSGKKYPCNLCPRSYGRKDSLRKHVRRKHISKSSKDVMLHKKIKTPKPKEKQRFLCTYCGQSYSSKSGLESHALTHTGERPFSCDICSKTFKRLKDLQLHRVIHSDEKPHQCSECGKAFKRVDKLKIHMRVHSELRPYKCNECEKAFKYPSVLRTHMHIHTGQTPFSCKTCGEAFSLRTSLNNHCLKNGHVK